jgi:TRAP-type uncharacterized transport system fused permease subunit
MKTKLEIFGSWFKYIVLNCVMTVLLTVIFTVVWSVALWLFVFPLLPTSTNNTIPLIVWLLPIVACFVWTFFLWESKEEFERWMKEDESYQPARHEDDNEIVHSVFDTALFPGEENLPGMTRKQNREFWESFEPPF